MPGKSSVTNVIAAIVVGHPAAFVVISRTVVDASAALMVDLITLTTATSSRTTATRSPTNAQHLGPAVTPDDGSAEG
ncbi:MAG: hypothetical protein WBM50_03105, partial [Acidimicrobiales bacterium]